MAISKIEVNSSSTTLEQGLAKAWCQANDGDPPTPNDSFNMGTLGDTASGRIEMNFASVMANDDYSMVGSQSDDGRAQNCYSPATTGFESMTTLTSNQNTTQPAFQCIAVFGDLA